jgi:hypothetical protein
MIAIECVSAGTSEQEAEYNIFAMN